MKMLFAFLCLLITMSSAQTDDLRQNLRGDPRRGLSTVASGLEQHSRRRLLTVDDFTYHEAFTVSGKEGSCGNDNDAKDNFHYFEKVLNTIYVIPECKKQCDILLEKCMAISVEISTRTCTIIVTDDAAGNELLGWNFYPSQMSIGLKVTKVSEKINTHCILHVQNGKDEGGVGSSASSHGDPIIWTFKGECYDLSKDGLYIASEHPRYNHKVWVGVYNDFIREIQITDDMDELLFSISNLNEFSGKWNYGLKERTRMCITMSWKECEWSFKQYAFDAQILRYTVQIMFHDYLDAALKEGERGVHLDIYPKVYKNKVSEFNPNEYNGVYFDNPNPEELQFCPAESERRS